MLEYGDHIAQKYGDEENKTVLDSINVLYVALTRPVKGLYIFTEKRKPLDQIGGATTYGDLFNGSLLHKEYRNPKMGSIHLDHFLKNRMMHPCQAELRSIFHISPGLNKTSTLSFPPGQVACGMMKD